MNEFWPYLILLAGAGVLFQILRIRQRKKKNYREIIEPELNRFGCSFISSETPRLFDVGPFPKIEFRVGGIQTETPIGSGEYVEYRIVRFTDNTIEKETWVKLEFEAFMHKYTTWNPHPSEADPVDGGQ